MTRGTTPIHVFLTDVDLSEATEIYISYSQRNSVQIEKALADITVEPDKLTVTLTQEETLRLECRTVEIQIRAKLPDGRALASNIMTTMVNPVLKGGAI